MIGIDDKVLDVRVDVDNNATVFGMPVVMLLLDHWVIRRGEGFVLPEVVVNTSEKLTYTGREDTKLTQRGLTRDVELERIRSAVKGIRFGEVRVIIQDGLVVQIERIEKERLR